ncbi:hypothetical protein ACNKHX_24210 [Shigella flexneri]
MLTTLHGDEERRDCAAGWLSTGMLCASASSNETGYLTQKFSRALGMLAVDNQARV